MVDVIAYRVERWLCRKGYGPEEPDEQDPDDALALVQAASLAGRTNLGRRKVRRVQTHGGREYAMPPRCAGCDGFTLHGGTAVGERDREGLERLCRYVARPALGAGRLQQRPDGTVRLELKTPWADGTTAIVLTPVELPLPEVQRADVLARHRLASCRRRCRERAEALRARSAQRGLGRCSLTASPRPSGRTLASPATTPTRRRKSGSRSRQTRHVLAHPTSAPGEPVGETCGVGHQTAAATILRAGG